MKKSIDIVIVSYNCADLLKALIKSIRENSVLSHDIWIIDNNSTEKEVKEYLVSISSNIHVVYNLENEGYAKAVNKVAKLGKSDFIMILNNDTEVTVGWDSESLKFMTEHPSCGVIGYKLINKEDICKGCGVDDAWKLRGWGKPIEYVNKKYSKPEIRKYVGGSALLTRRNIWEHLDGFNEEYFFYCEDAQYCLDVAKLGFKTYYIPHIIIHHHEGSLDNNNIQASRAVRNNQFSKSLKVFHKYYPQEKGYS